jgi:hypothetical protein
MWTSHFSMFAATTWRLWSARQLRLVQGQSVAACDLLQTMPIPIMPTMPCTACLATQFPCTLCAVVVIVTCAWALRRRWQVAWGAAQPQEVGPPCAPYRASSSARTRAGAHVQVSTAPSSSRAHPAFARAHAYATLRHCHCRPRVTQLSSRLLRAGSNTPNGRQHGPAGGFERR